MLQMKSCILVSWVCTYPSGGTSSGAEAPWEGESGRLGPSSPARSFHFFCPPLSRPSVRTLSGIIWRPGSASSQNFGVPWINPFPWLSCVEWWQTLGGTLDFLSETAARIFPLSRCTTLLVGYWCLPSKSPAFLLAYSRWLRRACRISEVGSLTLSILFC